MRIAQLSDLHLRDGTLYSGFDPWHQLDLALARARTFAPALLLLTGDLADDGSPATYARLAERLRGHGFAWAALPGNHDDAAQLRAALWPDAREFQISTNFRVDRQDVSLLLLDTALPDREDGAITPAHIEWLSANCPPAGRVLLALHHPPFAVGIAGMDRIGCAGGELLADWLAGQPQVEALLCGHVHRHVQTTFAGIPAFTCPSTVHQIALCDDSLAWTNEMPGFLLHDLPPASPMRTHHVPLAAAPVVAYE